ncbi:hypothetical protein AOLI_G00037460 [Acnodon oligacanthus]
MKRIFWWEMLFPCRLACKGKAGGFARKAVLSRTRVVRSSVNQVSAVVPTLQKQWASRNTFQVQTLNKNYKDTENGYHGSRAGVITTHGILLPSRAQRSPQYC